MKEIMENNSGKKILWIDPVGSLSDMVILSVIIKQISDSDPCIEFNLIRNTRFTSFFSKNPYIRVIDFPANDAKIIKTDYWNQAFYNKDLPVFKMMAKLFNIEMNDFSGNIPYKITKKEQQLFDSIIQWKTKTILIAPASDSPRKMLHPQAWQHIIQSAASDDLQFIQLGGERHIPGTYYLKNIQNPADIIYLIKKSSLVLTVDNEIMQLSYLLKKKAIFLLGPTFSPYERNSNQKVLAGDKNHCQLQAECLNLNQQVNDISSCPLGLDHCMNRIQIDLVINSLKKY